MNPKLELITTNSFVLCFNYYSTANYFETIKKKVNIASSRSETFKIPKHGLNEFLFCIKVK